MGKWVYENSLLIVLVGLFVLFTVGLTVSGWQHYNEQQNQHSQPPISYGEYIVSGDFVEAMFENWESEFLQMGMFVILTIFLRQKGSAESKPLSGEEAVDQNRKYSKGLMRKAPWPVKQGGILLKLYENSLSIVFFALFFLSVYLHAVGGVAVYNEEATIHGEPPISLGAYFTTSQFWFESFQNWQSEFIAIAAMIYLSIYLRQQGSTQSKPVFESHDKTGS